MQVLSARRRHEKLSALGSSRFQRTFHPSRILSLLFPNYSVFLWIAFVKKEHKQVYYKNSEEDIDLWLFSENEMCVAAIRRRLPELSERGVVELVFGPCNNNFAHIFR